MIVLLHLFQKVFPMSSTPAPLLFISHGAPTFALDGGVLGAQLTALGKQLTDVKALLIISPHWQTEILEVMTTSQPETIHDFYGFPQPLYELSYPALGMPSLALQTIQLLKNKGFEVKENPTRGLDHGAWTPLIHLLPDVNLPVFQVSLPHSFDPRDAYHLGQAISSLRSDGVLILCSGSMTHNLGDLRLGAQGDLPYVQKFSDWVKQAIIEDRLEALFNYRQMAPDGVRAHPTEEHFLPLFIALGSRLKDDQLQMLDGGVSYGILAMDALLWHGQSDALKP